MKSCAKKRKRAAFDASDEELSPALFERAATIRTLFPPSEFGGAEEDDEDEDADMSAVEAEAAAAPPATAEAAAVAPAEATAGEDSARMAPSAAVASAAGQAVPAGTTIRAGPPTTGEMWEPCEACGESFAVPVSLMRLDSLRDVLNTDTWDNVLTDEDRTSLQAHLPPGADQAQVLQSLFDGDNFHFGNPVDSFFKCMKDGLLNAQVQQYRSQYRMLKYKDYVHGVREYHANMISKVVAFRMSLGLLDDPSENTPLSSDGETDSSGESDTQDKAKPKHDHRKSKRRKISYVPPYLLFTTLKNAFVSLNLAATAELLARRVAKVDVLVKEVPTGFTLTEFVTLALNFLAAPPSVSPANTCIAAASSSSHPAAPLVQYDRNTQLWHWVDKSCTLSPLSRDEYLQSLEQLFWFAVTRNHLSDDKSQLRVDTTRQPKCVLTIDKTPANLVHEYRRQETERYRVPEQPFEFNVNSRKCVVAPLKKGVGAPITLLCSRC
eukprot:TRINITY_DN3121_c0_g1_i1.p1 TRINITY_DN3121_c0_g1~~TRINITY_DN3121_c0_g1_i1.p1  ORF type:complete len:515 (-),score=142.09 TRINITY_DN3121_c0_g1_i1:499-1980(-)